MKKLFALFLCLLLSVAVSACESEPEEYVPQDTVLLNYNDDYAIKIMTSFSDLQTFYNDFKERNEFLLVLPDLDDHEGGVPFYVFRGRKENSEFDEYGYFGYFQSFNFFVFVSTENDTNVTERIFTIKASDYSWQKKAKIENFNLENVTYSLDLITGGKQKKIPNYGFDYRTGDNSLYLFGVSFNQKMDFIDKTFAEKTAEEIKSKLKYFGE